jgi:hypothetical protein
MKFKRGYGSQFKYLPVLLLSLLAFSVDVAASDDTVQIKSVPYTDANGHSHTLTLYGGAGVDFAKRIICSKDNDCTLFGYTNKSFGETTDFLVMHLTSKSDASWAETFGGSNRDMPYNVIATSDDGFFTSGESESMFFTDLKIFSPHHERRPFYVKLDQSGKLQWAGSIDISSDISGAEIARTVQLSDGSYLLVGSYWEVYPDSGRQPMPDEWSAPAPGKTKGSRYFYPMVVKLAADGKPQWMRRYIFGDSGGMATGVIIMPSGNVLIAGSAFIKPDQALFMMEIDQSGKPVRTHEYILPMSQGANAFLQLKDGYYLVAGHVIAQDAPPHAFTALFSTDVKFVSGTLYSDPKGIRPLGMTLGQDGKVCVVGRTENASANKAEGIAWLLDEKSADLGEFWLTGNGNTELEDAAPTSAGGFDMIGDTNAFGAAYFDLIRTTWIPGPANTKITHRLTEEPYQPKVSDISTISQTGKTDLIRNIPADLIRSRRLSVPTGGMNN